MGVFKECDIRGPVGDQLDDKLAYQIGRAVGTMLSNKTITVCGDVRWSTPQLKDNLIKGLFDTGCAIHDLGINPTPVFYFAKKLNNTQGGVMITGSHNKAEYNGFKITLSELPITPQELNEIKTRIETNDFISGKGSIVQTNVDNEYLAWIIKHAQKPTRKLKVVVDAGNGAFWKLAPQAFQLAGYETIPLFCEPDPYFTNRNPNPASADSLIQLCKTVKEHSADYGAAFDSDGDRVIFVDENGKTISTDAIIAKMSQELLEVNPGRAIVYDLKCSEIVLNAIKQYKGKPCIEKSGHTFIKTRMLNENAVFGGEVSGHYFYDLLGGGDDGLFSALDIGARFTKNGMSFSHAIKDLPKYATLPDIRTPFKGNPKEIISRIETAIDHQYEILKLDGIRVAFPEGWALVRHSVTEPLLTFRFEAYKHKDLQKIIHHIADNLPEELQKTLLDMVRSHKFAEEEI